MSSTLDVSKPETSKLFNPSHSENIVNIFVTLDVFRYETSNSVRDLHFSNIPLIFSTLSVFSGDRSMVFRFSHPSNIPSISVASFVSNIVKSMLSRFFFPENKYIQLLISIFCLFFCVDTFITFPLSSSQATTPPSPLSSTSITSSLFGFVSSVNIIDVAVSGIKSVKCLAYVFNL